MTLKHKGGETSTSPEEQTHYEKTTSAKYNQGSGSHVTWPVYAAMLAGKSLSQNNEGNFMRPLHQQILSGIKQNLLNFIV